MTEFTVTGIRYQFPAELTYEERTEAAKQYVASLQKGTPEGEILGLSLFTVFTIHSLFLKGVHY
jgi:hypothetical protein